MSSFVYQQGGSGGGGGASASIFVTGLTEESSVSAETTAVRKISNPDFTATGLPEAYTLLEYIKSTGNQYIDTGYKPNTNTRIEIGASTTDTTHDKPLFGSRIESEQGAFVCWFNPLKSTGLSPAFGASGNLTTGLEISTSKKHDVVLENGLCVLDDKSFSFATQTFTSSYNLVLCGLNTQGTVDSRKFYGNVYYARIYDNDALVRDFFPAKRNSDGVLGLYDLVNGEFYTNAGTGSFVAGEEIPRYFEEPYGVLLEGKWTENTTEDYDPNTLLLLNGQSLSDESSYASVLTNQGVTLSSVQSRYGTDSLYFNGSSQLSTDGTPYDFGTGDFTIEAWVYLPSTLPKDCFIFSGDYSNASVFVGLTSTGKLGIGRAGVAWDNEFAHNISLNTWAYIVVCRKNGVIYFFNNGVLLGSGANTQSYSMQGGLAYVGSQGGSYYFTGYMNGLRISNIARYTEAFTPPAEPLSPLTTVVSNGFLISPIRNLGMWTVTATDGTQTVTQDVLVDVVTQYEIEMYYTYWLYKDGNEYEARTGGWDADNPKAAGASGEFRDWSFVAPQFGEDSIVIRTGSSGTSTYLSAAYCKTPIDITNWNKLKAVVDYNNPAGGNNGYSFTFGVGSTHPRIYVPDTVGFYFNANVGSATDATIVVDISSLQGLFYVQASVLRRGELTLKKVWLEE